MSNFINNSNGNGLNSNDFPLMDSQLLPLITKAENGDISAQAKLSEIFWKGQGTQKNYQKAKQYLDMLLNSSEAEENKILALGCLFNLALMEKDFGHFEAMKNGFHKVIDFMQEQIPMEDWDFTLFETMFECVYEFEEE